MAPLVSLPRISNFFAFFILVRTIKGCRSTIMKTNTFNFGQKVESGEYGVQKERTVGYMSLASNSMKVGNMLA